MQIFHAVADLRAFVVYPGTERYPLDRNTEVIGLVDLGRTLLTA